VSPEGINIPEGVLVSTQGEPCHHLAFDSAAFETGADAVAIEKEVHLLGVSIAQCASAQQAKQIAAMIKAIKEAAPAGNADRGRIIGEHLDRWTDNAAAAERFAELKSLAGPLRTSAFMLFAMTFVIGPVLYYSRWQPTWRGAIIYFAMLFSIWMLTVWDYSVCRKRLLGEKFSTRFRHLGMLLLSPASAMRSPEILLRNELAAFHPLATAAALCRKDRFASLARPMLLALEHPKPREVPGDPAACRIDAWFRKKLLKRLNGLLRRLEFDPAELLRPAEPLSDSRSYCPRCHNQFVLAAGTCPDCDGLALVPYAGVVQYPST
jgi:hypothetical protein